MSVRETREVDHWFDERTEETVISLHDIQDVVNDLTAWGGVRVSIEGQEYEIRALLTSHDTPAIALSDLAFILGI